MNDAIRLMTRGMPRASPRAATAARDTFVLSALGAACGETVGLGSMVYVVEGRGEDMTEVWADRCVS